MTRAQATAGMALVALLAAVENHFRVSAVPPAGGQPPTSQLRLTGYQVTFRLTQNAKQIAPATNDQITIVFSSRSVEGPRPPRPLFGDDIVQEFSFSGMDFANGQLRFSRRVRDKSFLGARYIRVVNHGSDGWQGDRIWLTVDGEEILPGVSMTPRAGSDPGKGIQKFNPRDWRGRTYWEAELAQFRGARAQ
jgi:hypothetical protein